MDSDLSFSLLLPFDVDGAFNRDWASTSFAGLWPVSPSAVGGEAPKLELDPKDCKDCIYCIYCLRAEKRIFPPQILDLATLKTLSVARNKLTSLPEPISKLGLLEKLDISGNHLSQLPSDFTKLSATLKHFAFSAAALTKVPDEVLLLKGLHSLDLSANKLSALPDFLGEMIDLNTLLIDRNGLNELPVVITRLKKLRVLNVSSNNLGDLEGYPFNDLSPELSHLMMSGSRIVRVGPTVGALKKLEVLDLSMNLLQEIPKQIGWIGYSLGQLLLNENQLKKLPGELSLLDPGMKIELRGNPLIPPFDSWQDSTNALFDSILPFCSSYGPNCELQGEAFRTGVKLKPQNFKLVGKDYKGRPRVSGGDHFEISLIKESMEDVFQVDVIIKDLKNGQYDVFYNSQQHGDFKLSVSCEGIPLKGSPFTLTIFEM
eukprot:TRINITY_DN183_c0_g1_i1.p2 TRINITY_DN183_c0_g1~~TRINITY_DN183_c0_g1_i1.p2  ORF type:complete len:430 (+),score=64.45 TRINITY_DN183_c0_g1_i1:2891-4180(+)